MSLLRPEARDGASLSSLLASRSSKVGTVQVNVDSALAHSAVWACLRLRADLISTMPVDVYRKLTIDGSTIQQPVTTPPVLVTPASHGDGQPMDVTEWLYSTQMDLDRCGNTFGLITERAGGLPSQVVPLAADAMTVLVKDGQIVKYRIGRTEYSPRDVWHERQFTVPGLHVGLSPIAYAAFSIGGYLSAQQFALDWFHNGAVPSSTFKNTKREVPADVAAVAKTRLMSSLRNGEPFVFGGDWEFEMVQATAATSQFIEEMQYGVTDVCRFLGVPADMIDAASSGSSITYANVTQRNLQLLIMNLGPVITRRERALSTWLSQPRFVKLNSDAILRMDPAQRATITLAKVAGKTLAPSEARAYDNLPPFTPQQLEELDSLGIVAAAFPSTVVQQAPAQGGTP